MRNRFRAEWQKIVGNTRPFAFLVLIYPIGALTIVLLLCLVLLVSDPFRQQVAAAPPLWNDSLINVWSLFTRYPTNIFLTMPFFAFTAVLFAGEYQWQTWKNVLPRQSRLSVMLIKFVALGLIIVVSLFAASLIWGIGGRLQTWIVGVAYGPALSGAIMRDFLQDYGVQLFVTFVSTLIFSGITALLAMYTRSILASVLLTIGLRIIEAAAPILLLIGAQIFEREALINWVAYTPTYSLQNVNSWLLLESGSTMGGMPGLTNIPSLGGSLGVILLWMVLLVGVTAVLFQRQDITT